MKLPTVLEVSIAESHARERIIKKIKEPCNCRACTYVQAFAIKQIQAQMAKQGCSECEGDCEE